MESAETQAAYFALLRAREEAQQLRTYLEYLGNETQRIRRSTAEAAALRDTVEPRYRRLFSVNDRGIDDVLRERQALINDELARLPARIEAAEAFVSTAEMHYLQLKDAPDVP